MSVKSRIKIQKRYGLIQRKLINGKNIIISREKVVNESPKKKKEEEERERGREREILKCKLYVIFKT